MTSKPLRVGTRTQFGATKGRFIQDLVARTDCLTPYMTKGALDRHCGPPGCSLEIPALSEKCLCAGRNVWRCAASPSSDSNASALSTSGVDDVSGENHNGEGKSKSMKGKESSDAVHVPDWLRDIGFGRDEALKILKRSPQTAKLADMVDVKDSISTLEGDGVSQSELRRLIRGDPLVLKKLDKLQECWELYNSYGVDSKAEFYSAMQQYPQMLTYSSKNNIRPSLEFLEECGLTKKGAKKILLRCPSLLWNSVEDSFKPFIKHFRSMGATDKDIARFISSNPFLLRHTIGGRMEGVSSYLSSLGLTREEIIKSFLNYPQIAGYSIENMMKPVVGFFFEQGASDQVVKAIVRMHPNILGLSLENNIRPKFLVITEILGRSADDFFANPSLLTRSLDKRILFRLAFLIKQGFPIEEMTLTQLFMPTNKIFENKHGAKAVLAFMDTWSTLNMEEKYSICRKGFRSRMISIQDMSSV